MRIGLQLPHFRPSTAETMGTWFRDISQAAETADFYSLWVMDHFFQLGGWLGEPEAPMIEGYTTLGFMAGSTSKIKLGLMVGGVIYRHPALVIKSVSTLDVLSSGRAYFGIGAGWYEHETVSLGMPFPTMKGRFEHLEDILRLAHHMWRGDTSEFEGTHLTAPYPFNNPQPLSQPHPPILIGGMGKKKTLRFVAQYGDACNLFGGAPDEVLRERLEILQGHCADVGRPYEEIEKTCLDTITLAEQSMDDVLARVKHLKEIGFSHIIFNVNGDYTPELLTELGEKVIAPAADL